MRRHHHACPTDLTHHPPRPLRVTFFATITIAATAVFRLKQ